MSTANKLFQAASGGAGEAVYVDDVFAPYAYSGNQTANTMVNGINFTDEGGLLWIKGRFGGGGTSSHILMDTVRGANKYLKSDSTTAETTGSFTQAFTTTGFSLNTSSALVNDGFSDYISWSFREAEKFFDIVTYTGDGSATRNISHNLGSTPGMIWVKVTSHADNWWVYHRSLNANSGNPYFLKLNSTGTPDTGGGIFTTVSDSTFGVRTNANTSGYTYVAYIFAHDEQVFGEGGDEAIIKCDLFNLPSYTDTAVTLGFEPQFLMAKNITNSDDWRIMDVSRGFPVKGQETSMLYANSNAAEQSGTANQAQPTPDGFIWTGSSGWGYTGDHVYLAIARPNKPPEAGTEVFHTVTYSGNNATSNRLIDAGKDWGSDLHVHWNRTYGSFGGGATTASAPVMDRMRGMYISTSQSGPYLLWDRDNEEYGSVAGISFLNEQDFEVNYTSGNMNQSGVNMLAWMFKRAPKFFDIVGYTGDGVLGRTIKHNLKVVPELLIVKQRNSAGENWTIWNKTIAAADAANYLALNSSAAANNAAPSRFNSTAPTSSVFTVSSDGSTNKSGGTFTYIAYLFATLDGVSKVGTYTGTGSDLNVDCGFTSGVRWLMIKRTDSTGNWYVFDSARGIVTGNDPWIKIDTSTAETSNTDYIDPLNAGFTVTSSAPADLNASGGTYIFLAIA